MFCTYLTEVQELHILLSFCNFCVFWVESRVVEHCFERWPMYINAKFILGKVLETVCKIRQKFVEGLKVPD